MADALHEGAAALQDLIRRLSDRGSADLEAAYAARNEQEAGDARDYRAMAADLAQDMAAHIGHASADHRMGYLRALADLLCMVGDGGVPPRDWDPIRNTAAAFDRPEPTGRGMLA